MSKSLATRAQKFSRAASQLELTLNIHMNYYPTYYRILADLDQVRAWVDVSDNRGLLLVSEGVYTVVIQDHLDTRPLAAKFAGAFADRVEVYVPETL